MQTIVRIEQKTPGFTTSVVAGKHNITVDEPTEYGGLDQGATPYDLLLASLGACTAITLKMYIQRKGWEVERIETVLEHNKIYAEDCLHCDEPSAKIDHIHRHISVYGKLDEAQMARLAKIANQCPVHKTLSSSSVIKTALAIASL